MAFCKSGHYEKRRWKVGKTGWKVGQEGVGNCLRFTTAPGVGVLWSANGSWCLKQRMVRIGVGSE